MKFIHTADLHIGKIVCEHSMLDEQRHILARILEAVDSEKPDAVLIAGDVYDKPVPSAEAVAVLDDFLVELAARKVRTFVLSGNHDSAERIAFGGRLMEKSGVHVSQVYDGKFVPVTLSDSEGEVDVWMLPFVRPVTVRANLVTDEERDAVKDYTSAVKAALAQVHFTPGRRNVLLAHQFVTGAERSESEENVGGLDNVDATVFAAFDYVALGHIHKPQNVLKGDDGTVRARYSGTPLKYSLSEAVHKKSLTVVELSAGKNLIREIPLVPLHDVREIRGTFAEIVSPEFRNAQVAAGNKLDDFVYIKLTDENDVPDAAQKLRGIYPNLMMLAYDNERTRNHADVGVAESVDEKKPMELFGEFFEGRNGRPMKPEESEFVQDLISSIWGGNA
ncbi:exonuclease SbcCD subunit D [Fibrobacter sp. UWR2]|uniref:exonuclease SbcCD subunit D n=1 Tax=Fibrobacter sp. UWR2 TaxID=1964352 RepID=UPI000B522E77|nr:exonuclease SbcCD subunit D [Fibrobacter sp. UWR2]OWU99290.1 exonuclease sbcCD subunit D [Fibrobacter sp. UWR2]